MRNLDFKTLVKFVAFMATVLRLTGSNSTGETKKDGRQDNEKELTKPLDSWYVNNTLALYNSFSINYLQSFSSNNFVLV